MGKLYHSPQWYYDHCYAENGGSPWFRKMLTNDMQFIGADIDETHYFQERIPTYEAKWNEMMSRNSLPCEETQSEMVKVMEKEAFARPSIPKRKKPKKVNVTISDRFFE